MGTPGGPSEHAGQYEQIQKFLYHLALCHTVMSGCPKSPSEEGEVMECLSD